MLFHARERLHRVHVVVVVVRSEHFFRQAFELGGVEGQRLGVARAPGGGAGVVLVGQRGRSRGESEQRFATVHGETSKHVG